MNAHGSIAAFFDLDGTLLPSPSLEWRFIGHLLRRGEISGTHLSRWLAHFSKAIWRNPRAATIGNKLYLAGLRESLIVDWERSGKPATLPFLAEGMAYISSHHVPQHAVFLISGTLAPLARVIAAQLPGRVEVRASELEVTDGRWTGWLAGDHLSGAAKADAVRSLASKYGIDLAASYAYGNQMADFAMLNCVGHPVAVNPSARLAWHARKYGWPVCRWNCPRTASTGAGSRILAAKTAR